MAENTTPLTYHVRSYVQLARHLGRKPEGMVIEGFRHIGVLCVPDGEAQKVLHRVKHPDGREWLIDLKLKTTKLT